MRLDDYLNRLGFPRDLEPTADTLRRLHVAHRETFLFENLSIQCGGGISLALADLERKFLDRGRGGYCFEHNTLFRAALGEIGFNAATHPGSIFRRTLTIQRSRRAERLVLRSDILERYRDGRVTSATIDRSEWPRLARELFDLTLPPGPYVCDESVLRT